MLSILGHCPLFGSTLQPFFYQALFLKKSVQTFLHLFSICRFMSCITSVSNQPIVSRAETQSSAFFLVIRAFLNKIITIAGEPIILIPRMILFFRQVSSSVARN